MLNIVLVSLLMFTCFVIYWLHNTCQGQQTEWYMMVDQTPDSIWSYRRTAIDFLQLLLRSSIQLEQMVDIKPGHKRPLKSHVLVQCTIIGSHLIATYMSTQVEDTWLDPIWYWLSAASSRGAVTHHPSRRSFGGPQHVGSKHVSRVALMVSSHTPQTP